MDQTYVLGPDKGGKRDCLYRYGNFCYVDTITVSPVTTGAHLARLLREMQAVQSKMKFISEVGDLKDGSDVRHYDCVTVCLCVQGGCKDGVYHFVSHMCVCRSTL